MGEGIDHENEESGPEPEDMRANICGNCKAENDWDARLCKICFAPLSAERSKLCPNCMTPCDESAHLCSKCLTPLSSHATIDPVIGITARMDTIGKAANAPRKPIVLIGMWLIFGPITFFLLLFVSAAPGLSKLIPAAIAVVPMMLLFKTTSNFLQGPPATDRRGFPLAEDPEEPEAQEPTEESQADEDSSPAEN